MLKLKNIDLLMKNKKKIAINQNTNIVTIKVKE